MKKTLIIPIESCTEENIVHLANIYCAVFLKSDPLPPSNYFLVTVARPCAIASWDSLFLELSLFFVSVFPAPPAYVSFIKAR